MDAPNLSSPHLYINRELAFLEFNRRVYSLCKDPEVPMLERLQFLCIAAEILDEFFEIRVAGLKQRELQDGRPGADGRTPAEQLDAVSALAHEIVEDHYEILNSVLKPELEAHDIRFVQRDQWTSEQQAWIEDYFENELAPILTPVGLDPAHPFPNLLNKSLAFIVTLKGKDAFGRESGKAVVQAPRALPRVVSVPGGAHEFVFLSSVIHHNVQALFRGVKVTGCYQFRVTRNSDLFVDSEEVDDLLRAMEGELSTRNYGDAVRLEIADDCPPELEAFLSARFCLALRDVYRCNGPVNLNRLTSIPSLVNRPELRYPGFVPQVPKVLRGKQDIFAAIRAGDVLLHHPFESFAPVVDFLRSAATDPNVLAIRQTLYRTGADSTIAEALVNAARAGKEVLVVIELRARFDEADNIELANRLQEAGAQVVYGIVGYKTHAKMSLVIRREEGKLVRYAHLGTGNYHAVKARIYTDYGLLTCRDEIGRDVQEVFHQLTAMGKPGELHALLEAPFTLFDGVQSLIAREIKHAEAGKSARIMAKMNSLIEPRVIAELYRASCAGVEIDLVVRGLCSLRPGIEGVSENIRVRSIVGRFLEHTRVLYFENDGKPDVYLTSADWMPRNFFDRIEVCFPVRSRRLRERIIEEAFENYLADNVRAWELKSDGSYVQVSPSGDEAPHDSQLTLLTAFNG
ncbi:MAG: polyphosphate kinase 1 [Gammaproteobacteria bacterium]|nr:polyphosphate kinase 1 [Gammaproteobacteria bacterium]MCY4323319.1 polyphosphate kinase 1 [Gammaproteobacteria bacterium]